MNAKFLIRVGNGADYQLRYGRDGYAVFKKTDGALVSYIIAREARSSVSETAPIPTSPLRELATEAEAVAALDKWATARKDPPLLKPRPHPTAYSQRNCNRPKRGKIGAGQMDLPL